MKLKKFGATEQKIFEIAKPIVDNLSLNIWDVCFEKEGSEWYLRVFIDKPEGISIDDCEAVSRPLSSLLDEKDPISQGYILEVGSAGMERRLLSEEHFKSCIGENVSIRLIRAKNNEKDFIGVLESIDKEKGSIVATVDTEGNKEEFLLSEIAFVKLYEEFEF